MTTLMLADLLAAFMSIAPSGVRRGGRTGAPPVPRKDYWTTVMETLSNSSNVRVVPFVAQVITMTVLSQAVFSAHEYGVPTTTVPPVVFRVMVVVLPVRFVVEVNSTASTLFESA